MSGLVVLISGASSGIGFQTAQFLAEQGCTVYAGTRDLQSLNEAALKFPGKVIPIILDVNDDTSVREAVGKLAGRIDVLINNAGFALMGPIEACTIQQIQDLFNTLVFGPIRLYQAVLPLMEEAKKGTIINIGSQSEILPSPSHEAYSAAKAALLSTSISLSARLAPLNIRVSIIEAGPVRTQIAEKALLGSEKVNSITTAFQQRAVEMMRNGLRNGESVLEVAKLVWQIIQSDSPSPRYQIGASAISYANDFLVDPTGKKDVDRITTVFIAKGLLPFDGF